jgi:cation:H+ antiporter
MDILYILAGLMLLYFGGDYLVKGASGIAIKLHITPMLVGMTVVALGTSAPELVVSLQAALAGKPEIALGNVVGSNIANVGLILGLTAIILPLSVHKDALRIDWLAMMLATLLFWVCAFDLAYSQVNGLLFVAALTLFIAFSFLRVRRMGRSGKVDIPAQVVKYHTVVLVLFTILGCTALVIGARWFLTGAEQIARYFGVTDRVIAVSLVAFGTSVPELAASIVAAVKREDAISLGNIIGSNLFNLLFIIGATSIIKPITVDEMMLTTDYRWMLFTSFAILPLSIFGLRLSRFAGVLLVMAYVAYIYFLLF